MKRLILAAFLAGCTSTPKVDMAGYCRETRDFVVAEVGEEFTKACAMAESPKLVPNDQVWEACLEYVANECK